MEAMGSVPLPSARGVSMNEKAAALLPQNLRPVERWLVVRCVLSAVSSGERQCVAGEGVPRYVVQQLVVWRDLVVKAPRATEWLKELLTTHRGCRGGSQSEKASAATIQ